MEEKKNDFYIDVRMNFGYNKQRNLSGTALPNKTVKNDGSKLRKEKKRFGKRKKTSRVHE